MVVPIPCSLAKRTSSPPTTKSMSPIPTDLYITLPVLSHLLIASSLAVFELSTLELLLCFPEPGDLSESTRDSDPLRRELLELVVLFSRIADDMLPLVELLMSRLIF